MFIYVCVRFLYRIQQETVLVNLHCGVMSCFGKEPSFSDLFKRIRCHCARCRGVITVHEAPDAPISNKANEMENRPRIHPHTAKTVSQPWWLRFFRWCQSFNCCRSKRRSQTKDRQEIIGVELGLHSAQPARRRFGRGRVFVNGKDEQWQADLVDMQQEAKQNSGYRFFC